MLLRRKIALIIGSSIGEATPCAMTDPDDMANSARLIPLGRLREPADIAGSAVFPAFDMARYIAGLTLPSDGGFLAY